VKYRLIAVCAAAAALAVPAAASAGVRDYTERAGSSLDRVERLATQGRADEALAELRRGRRAVRAANRTAVRLARSADDGREARRAVSAVRAAAALEDQNIAGYAALLDDIQGHLEEVIAVAMQRSLEARQQAIELLTQLMERLPEAARAPVAQFIAMLSADDEAVAGNIIDELSGGVPSLVGGILEQTLGMVTATLESVTGILESVTALLPGPAAQIVGPLLTMVTGTVSSILDMVLGSWTGLGGQGSPPPANGGGGGFALPGLDLVQSILGSLFGQRP
jgi:hypothetical protein